MLDIFARLPLAPLLLAQGLRVRRNAQLLPEPPGARMGRSGTGPVLRLLIIGDSSAAGVGAATQETALCGQLVTNLARDFQVTWRLEAGTGATTFDTLISLKKLTPEPFEVVVSALGVNDTTRLRSEKRWRREQTELLVLVMKTFEARHGITSGLPPIGQYPMLPHPLRWMLGRHAKRLDDALADLASHNVALTHLALKLPFEERYLAIDGYHPSETAYALWANLLGTQIRELLA
ncbi:SGNH/GDSL hydrolase family protein [Shimia abyssi]|uniref:Lysophospholipase L1-like esterase n=1 Tax=Shimia abyssi TaxID=1662395 RepID=A0A2P8FHT7_9RHOB|nr:SGNH/GDSL hydrolase family protein [Shimia abyssi]PSL21281.1 lysophospholipase L1-like esterase [Shimia abyssi]